MTEQLERVAKALLASNERALEELGETGAKLTWQDFVDDARAVLEALRPELDDARFQRNIVQQCFMLLEIACRGDERRVKFDALKTKYEVAARQEGK